MSDLLRAPLALLCADLPPVGGVVRAREEDFRVEELPAYEPSGQGEHLYITFEKTGLATPDAVQRLCEALGCDRQQAGWAGLKDKRAVTVQTVSLWKGDAERALALELPGLRVLSARRHGNKLKPGHLHGNRFLLRVRGAHPEALARAQAMRERLLARGVPNYYGSQRFGRDGDNAARALEWMGGNKRPPREGFVRKMEVSALQSALFNRYLSERLEAGLLDRYIPGDLAVRHPVERTFPIDPAIAQAEYDARRCSASGPMPGPSMQSPTGEALERERSLWERAGVDPAWFSRAGKLAQGTRRSLRSCLAELELDAVADPQGGVDLLLRFTLPAGGYATAVLRELRHTEAEGTPEPLQSPPGWGIEPPSSDDGDGADET